MEERRRGIVLRAISEYKSTLTLFDEYDGKIEGLVYKKSGQSYCHGALLSYTAKKNRSKYVITDIQLVDMPTYWTGEHFLFFHHVLELSDYFLPWDAQATAVFRLLLVLYTDPEAVETKHAQKVFLYHFFKRLGIYPEQEIDSNKENIESWLLACINIHPQASSLNTVHFLKSIGLHEEPA